MFNFKTTLKHVLTERTRRLMRLDYSRWQARRRAPARLVQTPSKRLHLACGTRSVEGWLNVDMAGGDVSLDVMTLPYPFADGSFTDIVCQHMIEHFDLEAELLPVLREIRRIAAPGARFWVSTPDLAKICRYYLEDKGAGLKRYMLERGECHVHDAAPPQQYINVLFHALGYHRNLLDFDLLNWALMQSGWSEVREVQETDLLAAYPGFPARNDAYETLGVVAIAS